MYVYIFIYFYLTLYNSCHSLLHLLRLLRSYFYITTSTVLCSIWRLFGLVDYLYPNKKPVGSHRLVNLLIWRCFFIFLHDKEKNIIAQITEKAIRIVLITNRDQSCRSVFRNYQIFAIPYLTSWSLSFFISNYNFFIKHVQPIQHTNFLRNNSDIFFTST